VVLYAEGIGGDFWVLPVRSKAAELCDESAKPKGPPRHRQKISLLFEHPLRGRTKIKFTTLFRNRKAIFE